MQTVTSADGTSIAYEQCGEGPPLVLLHGSSVTRRTWNPLRSHLAENFKLTIPDRRGRGDSGDSNEYGLSREISDLRTLVNTTDSNPTVFGHSFGGLVTLATTSEIDIDQLILYEPALIVDEHYRNNLANRMQERLDDSGQKEAMKLFYQESANIPEPEQMPFWPDGIDFDLVNTVIRENHIVDEYDPYENMDIDIPTLLLTGEHSPEHLRDAVFTLDENLPKSHLVELDNVGHLATESAPEQVASEVQSFTHETS